MRFVVRKLWEDATGATAPEYAMIIAVVLVSTIGAFEVLGNHTRAALGTAIQSVSPISPSSAIAGASAGGGAGPQVPDWPDEGPGE